MERMRQSAIGILRKLQDRGHTAYFAGGCVRDRLLGREPGDYDIATDATPDQILALFPDADTVGAHFGVVLVRRRGFSFEIATFREDGEYSDGRRPDSVRFTGAEQDSRRRDFTVNGLFEDPIRGELIDYVGGRADLDAGIIRAIGDARQRFREDYLRLLRTVRFAATLDFEVDRATWDSVAIEAENIHVVSPERIRGELDKIWAHPNRVRGFDLLADSGLMKAVLPEILHLREGEAPLPHHPGGCAFEHTRLMLSHLPPDAPLTLALAVLFHEVGKPAARTVDEADGSIGYFGHEKIGAELAERVLRRLKYSNAVIEAVVTEVSHQGEFRNVGNMRVSTLKRFMARETFAEELELHRVDCVSRHGSLANYEFLLHRQREYAGEPLIPEPFLRGHDLIARGVPPGPEVGTLLREAQDLQLEGALTSREESVAWLDDRLGKC